MGKQTYNEIQQTAQILPFVQTGEYYLKKGLKAYHKRDLYNAKKYLQRAIQLEPRDPLILFQLAVVLTEMGKYQQSNKLHTTIIEDIDTDMTECFYFLANNFAHLGLFQEAHKYATIYLKKDPDGEFAEDTEDLLELLTIESSGDDIDFDVEDDLILKQEKARELLEEGNLQEAISLLNEITEEYPEFWSAYNNLALAHFYTGEVDIASKLLEEVLAKNPGNLHALCNMLVFLYYQRKNRKVKELIRKLECIYPILTEHRYKLGATFGLVGRYDLSFKWLRKLQRQGFEGDETFYYWLSYAAYFTGHIQLSENAWKRVIEENPDKKGSEPWSGDRPNSLFTISHPHDKWLEGDFIEERLYGLFLASKSNSPVSCIDLKENGLHSTLEKEFAEYVANLFKKKTKYKAPLYIQEGYTVCEIIYTRNLSDETATEELYLTWFMLYDQMINDSCDLTNTTAWAAATEYVWRKRQNEQITQKRISEKYEISISTLGKYVKYVNQLFV
ncbi:tetratricopeptide repeat protein [Cytobacillus sp. S13-E01]|uniref:tetratricopeptide repeat protein n=1 Tax=Cytobacillus sp. S13-E01 TaxID=3031326 RepID=UPI0023D85297|nr:tetratricopeptide repeat protein [Cytobacillus sp. S13-E01]MDF0728298.1 tetratricopeptide repeat protein [Cytobacillus sp. S13-E01]